MDSILKAFCLFAFVFLLVRKMVRMPGVSEFTEKLELSYTAIGNVKLYNYLGK